MKSSTLIRQIFVNIIIILCTITVMSCVKKPLEDDAAIIDLDNIKSSIEFNLDESYILPSINEFLLDARPSVLSELQDKAQVLDEFQKELNLDPLEVLKQHLERKNVYEKSDIFSEIP